ncbi:hypothetical protein NITLEN_10860 [Nitrospira lenta]|uniref:Uncharacterized protein n=1 Tax=Nitrospira lenta TaxID=1436998 RepID=A0A330L2A5_9BACT|nr:hypothetical protein NITLEN_10860 [Nitrospira lenta]
MTGGRKHKTSPKVTAGIDPRRALRFDRSPQKRRPKDSLNPLDLCKPRRIVLNSRCIISLSGKRIALPYGIGSLWLESKGLGEDFYRIEEKTRQQYKEKQVQHAKLYPTDSNRTYRRRFIATLDRVTVYKSVLHGIIARAI